MKEQVYRIATKTELLAGYHALSDLGQGDAFRVGQSQPVRKFRSEDPVFRRQILILEE
jgi:hypothetical protein